MWQDMTQRKDDLSRAEIAKAFSGEAGETFPPILNLTDVACLLRRPEKTVREWMNKDRFKGCFRKRGKRYSFWRDRVVDRIFNGSDWE